MINKKLTKKLQSRLKSVLDSGMPYLLEQDETTWIMRDKPHEIIIKVSDDLIDLDIGDELAIRFLPATFRAFSLNTLYYCKIIKNEDSRVWCSVFYKEEFESEEELERMIKHRYDESTKKTFNSKCQECSFEGELDNAYCPDCNSFIFADVSYHEYCSTKEKLRELRKEFDKLKSDYSSPQKIKLDLGFANLVAEVYNSDYPVSEIVVCLKDADGIPVQDIAIIRQTIVDDKKQDAVECLVYSDELDEDYTHKFSIYCYKEEN